VSTAKNTTKNTAKSTAESKQTVVVVGGSGMLGSALFDLLDQEKGLDVYATYHEQDSPHPRWFWWEPGNELPPEIGDPDWIVNAAGMIRTRIDESDWCSVQKAVEANATLPFALARAGLAHHSKVVQIATDCVFSGKKGPYSEGRTHDEFSVYGRTKSLGEIDAAHVLNLRCSIVGREPGSQRKRGLLEWFLSQPKRVQGYTNHYWNGVTTQAFARVVRGLIQHPSLFAPGTQHLTPSGSVTKFELLGMFARAFDHRIDIRPVEQKRRVDRRLETLDQVTNAALWRVAGYDSPPRIEEMVQALAESGVSA